MDRSSALFRLFNEIGIIAQLSGRAFESVMPGGMTLAQFTVLNHFVRLGGARSPAELASAFQVTRATMTSTLQRLEGKGLIAIAGDPHDGRAKRVTITPAGAAMREACVAALVPMLTRLESRVDMERMVSLLPPLTDLRAMLDSERAAINADQPARA
jgi:DNA-binding MarR family transcriptional regulator